MNLSKTRSESAPITPVYPINFSSESDADSTDQYQPTSAIKEGLDILFSPLDSGAPRAPSPRFGATNGDDAAQNRSLRFTEAACTLARMPLIPPLCINDVPYRHDDRR